MSWEDYNLARQFLLEERIGTRQREKVAAEASQAKATASQIPRG